MLDEQYNPGLREAIKMYSEWPTIPQVCQQGAKVVGSAIVLVLTAYICLGSQPPLLMQTQSVSASKVYGCCAAVRRRGICGRRRHCGGDAQQGGAEADGFLTC